MKILLMSDTHGFMDDQIQKFILESDQVWHCGDFGSIELVEKIRNLKPLFGVYGNIDGHQIRMEFAEVSSFECSGLRVIMKHIGGYPPKYEKGVKTLLEKERPDLFISGHSHILKVIKDTKLGILHMNPGAAGIQGFHNIQTMLRFEIREGKIHNLQAIEFNSRKKINNP